MKKYELGKDLKTDVKYIYYILSNICNYNCHEGATVYYNILNYFEYKIKVLTGYYISPDLYKKGQKLEHSWLEDIKGASGGRGEIIETVPHTVFSELTEDEIIKNTLIPKSDRKYKWYCPIKTCDNIEDFKEIKTKINYPRILDLSTLIIDLVKGKALYHFFAIYFKMKHINEPLALDKAYRCALNKVEDNEEKESFSKYYEKFKTYLMNSSNVKAHPLQYFASGES